MTQSQHAMVRILAGRPRCSYPHSNAEFLAGLEPGEALRLAERKLKLFEGSDFTMAQISAFTGFPQPLLEAAADVMLDRALAEGA